MGFGDDMLHFNGLGERITGCDEQQPRADRDADKERYYESREMGGRTRHEADDALGTGRDCRSSADDLRAGESRDADRRPLRWSIAHLNDASPETLARMKALGVGWTVQDAMYFGGDQFVRRRARTPRGACRRS